MQQHNRVDRMWISQQSGENKNSAGMENMESVTVFNSQSNAKTKVFCIVSYVKGKRQNMEEICLEMQ